MTREEYLNLARRTMPDDLTHREKLAMLTMGAVGEWEEYERTLCTEEAGDVLWYMEQLIAELPEPSSTHLPDREAIERAKKWIFHGCAESGRLLSGYIHTLREITECTHGDLGPIYRKNVDKLRARYPEGFVEGGGIR